MTSWSSGHSATRDELVRVHSGIYLDELSAYCYSGGGDIDQDTYATLDSFTIAKYAAGAGLAVIEELQRRNDGVGFVAPATRHHALADRAMGFCLLTTSRSPRPHCEVRARESSSSIGTCTTVMDPTDLLDVPSPLRLDASMPSFPVPAR